MSAEGRFLIPFFQTPEEFAGPLPTNYRVGKPKKTWKGRVVDTRKRHLFTEKDVKRILRNILENEGSREANPLEFLDDWIQIESMLIQLLAIEAIKLSPIVLLTRLGPVIGELFKLIPDLRLLLK